MYTLGVLKNQRSNSKMEEDSLAGFGQLIARRLRDPAIERFENLRQGNRKAPALLDLQAKLRALDPETQEVVRRCVVCAVDSAIHDFLFSLQEGEFEDHSVEVFVDGENVSEQSDGLNGEIYGTSGWFAKYSGLGEPPQKA
jgi:hypothetical protein